MLPNNNSNMFGGNLKQSFNNNSIINNNMQKTTNNHHNQSFQSNNGSGLGLSLNYNELTNMQYPPTNNGNIECNPSSHATFSNSSHQNPSQTACYDNNFIRSNNHHHGNMNNAQLDLSNMFGRQHEILNNHSSQQSNHIHRNSNTLHTNQQHASFNLSGQYEPLIQSFSNPFQFGHGNQSNANSSISIEDTCVPQFCEANTINRRKQQATGFTQIQPSSISHTVECTSNLSPQPFIEHVQYDMNHTDNNTLIGIQNKQIQSIHDNNCHSNSEMQFIGEHGFEASEDASSSEHALSPNNGRKERVVASSVGKKVNGRYTKLRKQLRTFGGDFTDNYFVLDIAPEEEKKKQQPKGGKKRKSSPTENESEEEQMHNNRNHRSYTIHSSDYNNNIKIMPDMQNTSECIDLESRRRSSIGPISQSSTNPVIMIDSINNNSFNPQSSLAISTNNEISRPFSNPNNINISPRSSNSRDMTPPQEEQTDNNRSVQILLSLLMNSVNQQQQHPNTETSNTQQFLPPQSSPKFNSVNNKQGPQFPTNNQNTSQSQDDFSFLNMLMRQNNNK